MTPLVVCTGRMMLGKGWEPVGKGLGKGWKSTVHSLAPQGGKQLLDTALASDWFCLWIYQLIDQIVVLSECVDAQ